MSNYYYETIQVNVNETDSYIIESNSSVNTYGYIYKDSFNPVNPFENLLSQNDDSCNDQFKLMTNLQVGTTYILVVTTFRSNVIGSFSILVSNSNNIRLNRTSEYLHCFLE
jgi:hypothetical protein